MKILFSRVKMRMKLEFVVNRHAGDL